LPELSVYPPTEDLMEQKCLFRWSPKYRLYPTSRPIPLIKPPPIGVTHAQQGTHLASPTALQGNFRFDRSAAED